MAVPVLMPRQGQSVETCLILSWKKKEGDSVAAGEVLCEVETDKASFEVEAPESGTLIKRFFDEGDDVPVLRVIAAIGEPGENVEALAEQEAAEPAPKAAPPTGAPAGTQAAAGPAQEREGQAVASPTQAAPRPAPSSPESPARRLTVSPRARKRARDKGVDLTRITGTGPGGRIIERDVLAAAALKGTAAAPQPAAVAARPAPGTPVAGPESEEVPVTGVRRIIAERMLASVQNTAQLTMNASADARSLRALRSRLKKAPEEWGLRDITITDLVLFAVSRLLPLYPEVNSHFLGDRIVRFRTVNLAFAVDTPRGLMVPVVRGAQELSLRALSAEAKRLAAACTENTVNPDELGGGTFTVTNLGQLGVESFTPVLNPPQNAILGVGSITLRPVRDGESVQFVEHLGLSLTINHQAVDGAPGARFLQALCRAIEQVDLMSAL